MFWGQIYGLDVMVKLEAFLETNYTVLSSWGGGGGSCRKRFNEMFVEREVVVH